MKSPAIFILSFALMSLKVTAAFSSSHQMTTESQIVDSLEHDKQILLEFIEALDRTDNPYPYQPLNWSVDNELTDQWEGVTLANGRVIGLSLPGEFDYHHSDGDQSRRLDGKVPESFNQLTALKFIKLSGNHLRYLPDLTGLEQLDSLDISHNRLGFESIVPNLSVAAYYEYSPQRRFGRTINDTISAGEAYTLTVDHTFEGTEYQWGFGELIPGYPFNNNVEEIAGATSHDLVLNNVGYEQLGTYRLSMTHPDVPELTIEGRNINLWAFTEASGIVSIDNSSSPMVAGEVIAFRITPAGPYVPEDTVQVVNGEFRFEKIVLGDFVFLARPDRVAYPLDTSPGNSPLIPTYYGDVYRYQDAEVLAIRDESSSIDINLVTYRTNLYPNEGADFEGELFIDLHEAYDDCEIELEDGRLVKVACEYPEGVEPPEQKYTRERGVEIPCFLLRYIGEGNQSLIQNYDIYAYDESGEDGLFHFDASDGGFYRLEIQYPGVAMDTEWDIEFVVGGAQEHQLFQLISVIGRKGISTVCEPVLSIDNPLERLQVFPNPTDGLVRLELRNDIHQQDLRLDLINMDGKSMQTSTMSPIIEGHSYLDLSELPSGMYILLLSNESGNVLYRERIVKK